MTITRSILLSLLAVGGLVSVASAEGAPKQVEFRIEYVDGKKTIVIEKPIEIVQKVPRPSVIYVVGPADTTYQWDGLALDFRARILGSVKKAPF